MLRYRWVTEVAKEASSIPDAAKMPPAITTGLGPYFVLRALPTGPEKEEEVLRDLRRPSQPRPASLAPPSPPPPSSPYPFRGRVACTPDPGAALTPELLHGDPYGGDPGDPRRLLLERRH